MTSGASYAHEFYPRYCYHLSPTLDAWCPLRASDIRNLAQHPGFEGQDDVFFYTNHPIRWVRIVGVVVAIDEYYGRRIYTVDDSSGTCVECSVSLPTSTKREPGAGASTTATDASKPAAHDPYPDIDVGLVVEVKGGLTLFRDQKQIKVHRLRLVRSTNQEVRFWTAIRTFRADVLARPWFVEGHVVRRLRREQEEEAYAEEESKRRKAKKKKKKKEEEQ